MVPMSAPNGLTDAAQLRDINQSARIGPYLGGLWARRSYIWYVSLSDLRNQQVTTVLGNMWHLLNPALSIAVYYLIFGVLLSTSRGVNNYILFLTVGIFIFQYSQRATIEGAKSIVNNVGVLKAIQFPRALLPLTSTLTETLASLSTFVIIYVVAILTREPFRWQWGLLIPLVAGQFVFNVGAAMMAARATTHFRDITQILPFLFRLLLYLSGVIFSVEAYVDTSYSWLFTLNPFYCYITIGRWCIMGTNVSGNIVWSAALWTIALLIVGFLWFRAAEERYTRD